MEDKCYTECEPNLVPYLATFPDRMAKFERGGEEGLCYETC